MTRVLVLRQKPEAAETAALLLARGHQPVLLPLAETVFLQTDAPSVDVSGFVVTSLQAVSALGRAFPGDGRPVLAVGERTADALSAAGFPRVETGSGTAEGLVRRAADISASAGGRALLYAAGRVRRPDFEAGAAAAGLPIAVWEVYDLAERHPGAGELDAAFGGSEPVEVLVLSVGQAEGFSRLWARTGEVPTGKAPIAVARFGDDPRRVPALLCLSERISQALSPELAPFARISPQPKLSSLFDRFLPPKLEDGGSR